MSHIKRKHLKSTQVQDFTDVEKDFRKHTTNKKKQDERDRKRKIDEEGFKEQRSKAKRATRNKKRTADEEGFMEEQRKAGQVSKKKRLEEDPKKFRKFEKQACRKYKRIQRGSHQAAVKRFYQETRYGPVFGCVCCGIENFRHNVVPWNEKTQAQIWTKANDAHIRDYNSKLEQVVATLAVYF